MIRPPPRPTPFPYTPLSRPAGALPAGLSLVAVSPGSTPAKDVHIAISGTPTTVQTSTFTIRATDANGLTATRRSEEHTSELQSRQYLVCRLLLEKKKSNNQF